ncbi:MAG: tRNA N6-adenosine threonylcarbamoyltransferase [Candidatus Magasanikbacteria bacterium]|nr:tRNA N6-adenosine threonylcarbamoyltransferase [Candidatus Magasanikbacteria bacterium]
MSISVCRLLAIETSCDDTSVAVIDGIRGAVRVIAQKTASQIKIHAKYGGIVPELAAREHTVNIPHVLAAVFKAAHLNFQKPKIDAIAVTAGPGLITSLFVGVETARALSYAWKKPLMSVNHLEGHIYSNWLAPTPTKKFWRPPEFPVLNLIVSGGHTELVLMKAHGAYKLLGATRDDAAGECFDKIGKLLGFEYPGGPKISVVAKKGNRHAVELPRPMINSNDFDFSFAGLKTAARLWLEKNPRVWENKRGRQNFCASFEQTIVDVLIAKTLAVVKKFHPKTVTLSGGVAANIYLREQMDFAIKEKFPEIVFTAPPLEYTSDNAAMIGVAAYFHIHQSGLSAFKNSWRKIKVDPEWQIAA